ncbi:hypothetical protein AXG93_3804s1000 [Marchantia polymorpha subsp. ruderalis]|uniref:Dirigent protein n=1 Tax=Marchantia polymorpha subsp. ruderalis TaxID=1480154 RepID=A0A176WI15_MARPO|nr:hypothetical protein AXG93_3804s1000 [Marchantia polymorpha subsp. ruderalis]
MLVGKYYMIRVLWHSAIVFKGRYAALRAPDMTIYIFRIQPPAANATVVVIYPLNTLPPYPVGIPVVSVGDQPIRLTASEQSQIIGRQRTMRIRGNTPEDQNSFQSNGVFDLKINGRNGTISFPGIVSNIAANNELAIIGGTGAYESASGRVKINLVTSVGSKSILK